MKPSLAIFNTGYSSERQICHDCCIELRRLDVRGDSSVARGYVKLCMVSVISSYTVYKL